MRPGEKGKRILGAAWLAAGIFLAGYNQAALRGLSAPPSTDFPGEIRRALKGHDRLLQLSARRGGEGGIDINRFFSRHTPAAPVPGGRETARRVSPKKNGCGGGRLPALSGILRRVDIHGKRRLIAVMAGMNLAEHQRVDGFTVHKITEKGVILKRGAERWFLPAPNARYSLDVSAR